MFISGTDPVSSHYPARYRSLKFTSRLSRQDKANKPNQVMSRVLFSSNLETDSYRLDTSDVQSPSVNSSNFLSSNLLSISRILLQTTQWSFCQVEINVTRGHIDALIHWHIDTHVVSLSQYLNLSKSISKSYWQKTSLISDNLRWPNTGSVIEYRGMFIKSARSYDHSN